MKITKEEKGWIAIMRLKKLMAIPARIDKRFSIGRLKFHIEKRSKEEFWGRFGGGWNWKVGFQIGGKTIIFNLLVGSLRITWEAALKK